MNVEQSDAETVRVVCTECHFSKIVAENELSADVLIEHGEETGHTLTLEVVEDPQ